MLKMLEMLKTRDFSFKTSNFRDFPAIAARFYSGFEDFEGNFLWSFCLFDVEEKSYSFRIFSIFSIFSILGVPHDNVWGVAKTSAL